VGQLKQAVEAVTLGLAVARATRFVTSDWLGEWAIQEPIKRWAEHSVKQNLEARIARGDYDDEQVAGIRGMSREDLLSVAATDPAFASTPARVVKGLNCPFCVGFWVGLVAIVLELALTPRSPHSSHSSHATLRAARKAWKVGKAAFALNYLVGHVSSRID